MKKEHPYKHKCFTYVTKTIINLTAYSRKPGDCNGFIIFEIDIMKNSSPLNLEFTFLPQHSQLSFKVNQNKRNDQRICQKVQFDKNINWLGRTFSWYQSQKYWCHCNSPVFYYKWLILHKFWWHKWKIYKHNRPFLFRRAFEFLFG